MTIPDPYGTAFCAELVVALDFDLLFKSCSTYCDKFECHAAPLALSCICHFTENDIFIGNHKGSSCCTPKPLPDNLHTIEPNSFCCQIHARFHDVILSLGLGKKISIKQNYCASTWNLASFPTLLCDLILLPHLRTNKQIKEAAPKLKMLS